ncbi:alpha/beta hydrolase [Cohnella zeiphila]|uniref:Alpha/beta fold hydrolase n=1 Tax=Cohnella zeiphila TaxID=2761120 RepID=A0A7X0VVY6_9BACL|nr:alpha/beta fold hydrolase [Cohnella zeiphila]MBB6732396.1 alpha/beta fold hydrolase [Cohnella zeiphila]
MEHDEYCVIAGVPCIVHNPAAEPIGIVVLYHGWGSTMDSYQFFASLIANWGYRVIVPELPWHGQRGSLDYSDEATLQSHFWSVVFQGVQEADRLVAELSRTTDSPILMIGHSTGGFISAGTFASNKNVHAAVVVNGSCAWVQFEQSFREKLGLSPMNPDEKDALRQRDPFCNILTINKPLLLLHCQEDTSVPIDSQRYLLKALSDSANAEYIQLFEYPGVNHQITLGMLQKIHEFLGLVQKERL